MRVLMAGVLALAATLASAPAATADEEAWFYRWSDGSRADARTIPLGWSTLAVPSVVVTVRPAAPGRHVVIQVRHRDRWLTEDAALTDARGRAVLGLNPFCVDGDWCRGTLDYRVVAGGRTAALQVTYRR